MNQEPLNTAPIQQFIQQVRTADASGQKEVKLDIIAAKRLALTLGEAMARLTGDLEKLLLRNAANTAEQDIVIQVNSSSNWGK